MVRADQKPGRRRADPAPRTRRSPRPETGAVGPKPKLRLPRPVLRRGLSWRALTALWLTLGALGIIAVGVAWTPLAVPRYVPLAGAVTLTTALAFALAARTGGRALISAAVTLGLAGSAAISQAPVMLAGAAVGTAVLAAVFAVMNTKPAARFVGVVREVGLAILIAVVGAFAVEAYEAQVSLERVGYLVLGLSLLSALGLVYRLGAGLHGLGKRGFVMLVSGIGLLTVTLAYTEALARWGSPGLIESIDATYESVLATIGAVPRPIEVLLGFPALAWGVSTRARRRQGWWVCTFGVAGLSTVAVSLLDPSVPLLESGLTLVYSAVLGLAFGYLVIRADLFLTGPRGRRARRLEEASAHRPEPGRLQPLL